MKTTVKISVRRCRNVLYFVYQLPGTEERTWERTKFSNRKAALRAAKDRQEQLEHELFYAESSWDGILQQYQDEHMKTKSPGYRCAFNSAMTKIRDLSGIKTVLEIDRDWVGKLTAEVVDDCDSINTAASYLRSLRTFVNWMIERQFIKPVKVRLPSIPDSEAARGEPITFEQFEKIIQATPLVVEAARSESFENLLYGYWYSGFRLSELLRLSWDDKKQIHVRNLDTEYPVVVFPKMKSKGKVAELWPIPDDFAMFLRDFERRTGNVFQPLNSRLKPYAVPSTVGKVVADISERSSVTVVGSDGEERFATANDIRRAFITRMFVAYPDNLDLVRRLARHKSLETTMRYYAKLKTEQLHKIMRRQI